MAGRKAIVAAIVLATLVVTGGLAGVRSPGDDQRTPQDRPVPAELLFFHQGHGTPPDFATVLRSPTDARAVLGWFTYAGRDAPDPARIGQVVAARDYSREAVIVFSFHGGCNRATGARLTSTGSVPLLRADPIVTESRQECYAPYRNVAIFALEKGRVPQEVIMGLTGRRPDPVGPGKLLAFTKLTAPRPAHGAEVSQPDQLDRFLDSLPGPTASGLRDEDLPHDQDQRRFAFVFPACQPNSAFMTITGQRLAAEPDTARRCENPDHHAAIFAIDANLIPPTATIG